MFYARTDLALEARELYTEAAGEEAPGIEAEQSDEAGIRVTRVRVVNEEGERSIGKSRGNYITVEAPGLGDNDPDTYRRGAQTVACELKKLIKVKEGGTTLVVGLGNSRITPDSVGPRTISGLIVTRHLFSNLQNFEGRGLASVCAFAPGVLGVTGMETLEVIRGITERIKPDTVIAVDALASRNMDRISTTVQITDTGISPGSGVGNRRQRIAGDTLGVPVIAIGVPTVIDAATLANDTVDKLMDRLNEDGCRSETCGMLRRLDRDEKNRLIQKIVPECTRGLMVTPKDIDSIAERVSAMVANGINLCLHEGLDFEDINSLLG